MRRSPIARIFPAKGRVLHRRVVGSYQAGIGPRGVPLQHEHRLPVAVHGDAEAAHQFQRRALQQQIAVAGAGVGGGVSVAQVKPGQLQALAQFLRERLRVQYDKSPRHAVCTHQRDEFRRCLFQKRVVLGGVRRQLSRRDGAVLHKALVQFAQYLLRQAEVGPAAHHIVFQIARPALYALVQHRVCIFVHAFQQA